MATEQKKIKDDNGKRAERIKPLERSICIQGKDKVEVLIMREEIIKKVLKTKVVKSQENIFKRSSAVGGSGIMAKNGF